MNATTIQGRTWVFGDDINTDLIQPSSVVMLPIAEQVPRVFEANRPGWAEQVQQGDIIIAGRNFGLGSSRPASKVLAALGIAAVVAESINGLFYRNCVNFGLPALSCPGVLAAVNEREEVVVDLAAGTLENIETGIVVQGRAWAEQLLTILSGGGLIESLERDGRLLTNTTRS